jgi:CheY-like chemotaxis protein
MLAEDDDGHATLIERNLRRIGLANHFVRAHDGIEALEMLERRGADGSLLPGGPLLLVLDVKMPRMDGIELLGRLKGDSELSQIPVIMLTTTDDAREISRCYQLGCNVYITKPVDYDAFIEAIRRLGLFLQVVRIPNGG